MPSEGTAAVRWSENAEADRLRANLQAEVAWFTAAAKEGEVRWIKVTEMVREIRDRQHWRAWNFNTFDSWLMADCDGCRRSIYSLLSVVDRLDLPPEEMESIGKSKLYELARVAKHKPAELPALVERVKTAPELTVAEVKTEVAGILAGSCLGSGKAQMYEFYIPNEDRETIEQALLVARVRSEVADDSPSANGALLVAMAQSFLAEEESITILGQIEEAR